MPMNQDERAEAILRFAKSDAVLRRNDADTADTEVLQVMFGDMAIDCGPADGIFGGRTEQGVEEFQGIRMDGEGQVDGVVGPNTKRELAVAHADAFLAGQVYDHQRFAVEVFGGIHPTLGTIPDREGKMSTFGGPKDAGDRGYGQALVPVNPSTVEALYRRYPELVELGLFTAGLEDPLPMTTCCGRTMRAGISWCLDPDSYYLAMRWGGGKHRPRPYAAHQHRVLIIHGERAVVAAPTDWGPAHWTGRDSDLSPGCADALFLEPDDQRRLRTDSVVQILWAANGAPLGPVALS